ncbi:CBS domain-containing protein [Amycolatopsis taiwanensis]|uniref:CBS domain-containing protein n=1 Tax=Amycolatopsis taiwanensis TaxID=342230 RepID=UPI0025545482|nr:CBS domain-containing protein [Amycolatopsis taiwanensis]
MSTPATTIGAEAPLRAAVRSLASAQLRHLCVVDRIHRLVGVLALLDALRLFLHGDAAFERTPRNSSSAPTPEPPR